MSSQLQAFGSWRIILLNSDDLGDDGDVLTRVGENAAAFLPAGGGNPFDQDLNTDDAVVFGSGSFGTAPFASAGDIRVASTLSFLARNTANDGDLGILAFGTDRLKVGDENFGTITTTVYGQEAVLSAPNNSHVAVSETDISISVDGGDLFLSSGIDTYITSLGVINLTPTGDLNINGTPGVTNAAIVVDGVTLSFTKGILTGVA